MIRLEVEEYCQQCLDFAADVTRPERVELQGTDGTHIFEYSDTIVHCKYRKRCSAIKRYLETQAKGEEK